MIIGLWRWQGGGFSLLSFDRSIIERAIPQLATLESPDLAQGRLRVGNLQGSQLSGWINSQWYQRGWKSSHGKRCLLDSIIQQLKVPEEEALDIAQQLLDVRLQCPLGGEFLLQQVAGAGDVGSGPWMSTAWRDAVLLPDGSFGPPANYTAPWLGWFRVTCRPHATPRAAGNCRHD